MLKLLFSILLSLALMSCASVKNIEQSASVSEHKYSKNYVLGVQKEAYIGEAIIKLKDYFVIKKPVHSLQVKNDFKVTTALGINTFYGTAGSKYPIAGKVEVDGETLMLIQGVNPYIRLGINSKGKYANYGVGELSQRVFGISVIPKDTIFEKSNSEKVDLSRGFTNYEIIFTGMTSQSINLLYREFTPSDLAKPAFYQRLTYPNGSKFIRFKKINIAINTINSSKIIYTIIEDGLHK